MVYEVLTVAGNSICTCSVFAGPIPCSYGQSNVDIGLGWINDGIKAEKSLRWNKKGIAVTDVLQANTNHMIDFWVSFSKCNFNQ